MSDGDGPTDGRGRARTSGPDPASDEVPANADRSPHADAEAPNRRRAVRATLPFLALGLGVVTLAVLFAPQPLWGFLFLPPVLFMAVLTYVTLRSDFFADR